MFAAGQHADRQALVLECRGRDRGAFAARVGAHAEDPAALGLVHDGGVDVRVVGGGDGVPGAVEIAVLKGLSVSVIPPIASTAGVADREMTCTSAPVAISSGRRRWATVPPPTTTTFLPARRRPTRYGVIGHPASLEVAAAATKRVVACGRPAGWVWR